MSIRSLQQLAVDGLVNRHLLLSLKNSPVDISLADEAKEVTLCSHPQTGNITSLCLDLRHQTCTDILFLFKRLIAS